MSELSGGAGHRRTDAPGAPGAGERNLNCAAPTRRSRSDCSPWMQTESFLRGNPALRRDAGSGSVRRQEETWAEHFEPGRLDQAGGHGQSQDRRRAGNSATPSPTMRSQAISGQGDLGRGHDRRIAAGHYATLQSNGQVALPGRERSAYRGAEPAWDRGDVLRRQAGPRERTTARAGLPGPGPVQADQRPVRPPGRGRSPGNRYATACASCSPKDTISGGSEATNS